MFENAKALETIRDRLIYMAWRHYHLTPEVAEDLVQSAITTFLEVKERYPVEEEQPRVLAGIFRNKCREHIGTKVREKRRNERFGASADAQRENPRLTGAVHTADDGVLDALIQKEDVGLILDALSDLQPEAREMFTRIIEGGASRQDLIEEYGLNKNTLDSRLHVYRRRLREILERRGLIA